MAHKIKKMYPLTPIETWLIVQKIYKNRQSSIKKKEGKTKPSNASKTNLQNSLKISRCQRAKRIKYKISKQD